MEATVNQQINSRSRDEFYLGSCSRIVDSMLAYISRNAGSSLGPTKILLCKYLINRLQRGEECDTYLTHIYRYPCSFER